MRTPALWGLTYVKLVTKYKIHFERKIGSLEIYLIGNATYFWTPGHNHTLTINFEY